ncbi:MAG: hypothetical protein GZ091_19180 [Paludibacter sp.]|jgi:Ca2+/Na+ antiporter|uniref:Uncharacterized protein n=1 Tax=Flavobacterium frigoris TaxID=229204 RepID=A0A1H9BXW6_FLAFI|nr:hypothetical protein [Flavobacterium frigoris]NDP23177.1 hypothetical protein [Paludibacter sp.]SEP93846.1 hypothetical protein SAMN05444355_10120 [Flavobacterium frigoris]
MDFKDIQSAWNNDKSDNVVLPANLEKLQSANMPLEKIRKNLKKDFLIHLFGVLFVGIFSLFIKFNPTYKLAFYIVYVFSFVITVYFLVKLYFFYKKINDIDISTKDNLYETYFEIRLFEEVYKLISYALMPSGLIYMILIPLGSKTEKVMKIVESFRYPDVLYVAGVVVFIAYLVSLWFLIQAHAEMFYGKYAKEVKRVIDELKEE